MGLTPELARRLYAQKGRPTKSRYPPGKHPLILLVNRTVARVEPLPEESREGKILAAEMMLDVRTRKKPKERWMLEYFGWAVRERLRGDHRTAVGEDA